MKRRTPSAMPRTDSGISLVEVIISTGILSMIFLGIGATVSTGATNTKNFRLQNALLAKAQEMIDACRVIPFGMPTDPALRRSDLLELFDGDPEMGTDVTLYSLRNSVDGDDKIIIRTKDAGFFPAGFESRGRFVLRIRPIGLRLESDLTTSYPDLGTLLTTSVPDDAVFTVAVHFVSGRDGVVRRVLATKIAMPAQEGAVN